MSNKLSIPVLITVFQSLLLAAANSSASDFLRRGGAIIRGPTDRRQIAIVFTAHTFAESGAIILDELARHHARASFFFTGEFLTNPAFQPLIRQVIRDGDYLGPHSDKHLLYATWDNPPKLLVTRQQFRDDLNANLLKIEKLGIRRSAMGFFLPAYEQSNPRIAQWSREMGLTMVNFTPGTRSNADYTGEADKKFVPSQTIYDSIIKKERDDPHGLNGFILLLHLGAGPGRKDKFANHFGELLDYLSTRGYQFVRIDELLGPADPP